MAGGHERRVSRAQLKETKSFEGFRSRPYKDSGGTWTVGYGETTPTVVKAARVVPLPEPVASRLLRRRMDRNYGIHVDALGLPLTQAMYDALTDLVYNKGPGTIEASTLLGQALRAHRWHRAAHHILDYDRDRTGTQLAGLVRRREANRRRFLSHLPA